MLSCLMLRAQALQLTLIKTPAAEGKRVKKIANLRSIYNYRFVSRLGPLKCANRTGPGLPSFMYGKW